MCHKKYFSGASSGIAALLLATSLPNALALVPAPVVLQDSTRPVAAAAPSGTANPKKAFISRQTLTSAESNANLDFEVALKMRNVTELQARLSRGERISFAEMAQKYEPLPADYQAVVDWLTGQGFTITRQDSHHLAIFVSGKVGHIAQALQVNFARVTAEGKEYTSAVTAPSVPAKISTLLLGINGLQPHLRAHKHLLKQQLQPNGTSGGAAYTPSQIAQAYGATGLYNTNISGAGETIAIVIDTFPSATDLLQFWSNCNINQSINNIEFVQVVPGVLAAPSGEETLDVEWSSAMAPGAHIRVYAATDLGNDHLDQAYNQVLADVTKYGIHQMSMSYGIGETYTTNSQVQADDAIFMELAAAGVTIFASSGDGGSTPGQNSANAGDETGPLQVESPASDPNVAGVGGTTLMLDSNNNISSEAVWNNSSGATGGGSSIYFSRPTWQTGPGVPLGTMREVPDVAAAADPDFGAILYEDGARSVVGGTSWASPTCAGLCALFNQARKNVGLAPAGAFGPFLYALLSSPNYFANFNDITSGNNATSGSGGLYSAQTNYDRCTGVGSPKALALAQSSVSGFSLIGVQMAPAMLSIVPGQIAMFTVAVGGSAATYQWQRMSVGSTTWNNLSDDGTYSGSTAASLTVANATSAMSGDQFQCLITMNGKVVTTTPSVLVVETPFIISTLAGVAGVTGNGTTSDFNFPSGVAVDSAGNIYVADFSNNSIRKVTPGGTVSTPYGSPTGQAGSTNASGNNALFDQPNGIAVDSSNNLYVADTKKNLIRKISSGSVTTLAGSGREFKLPEGIAVDNSGNVYVADTGNDTIDKITPGGSVSIVAGQTGSPGFSDGAATTQALFNAPNGLAVDGSGNNIYVADTGNCVIRKISAGVVSTIAGRAPTTGSVTYSGYLDGPGNLALFNSPTGVVVDSLNNLYVTDCLVPPLSPNPGFTGAGNNLLRKVTPAGVVSTLAGQAGNEGSSDGTGNAAQFFSLQALALNSTTDTFYLADTYNQTIRMGVSAILPTISIAATQPNAMVFGSTPGQFTVTRTGNISADLTVTYSIAGSAVSGTDYTAIPTTVEIPSGVTSKVIAVDPISSSRATSNPTVQLTLSPDPAYIVGSPSTATVTIEETTPYQNWKISEFGANATVPSIGGDLADPNHNGVPNFLEYAFNSDPLQTGTEPLPVLSIVQVSGLEYLALTFTEINDTNLTYAVQVTSDLTQHTDQWHSGNSFTTLVSQVVNGNTTQITVRDNTAISQATERFIRVQVTGE